MNLIVKCYRFVLIYITVQSLECFFYFLESFCDVLKEVSYAAHKDLNINISFNKH